VGPQHGQRPAAQEGLIAEEGEQPAHGLVFEPVLKIPVVVIASVHGCSKRLEERGHQAGREGARRALDGRGVLDVEIDRAV